MHLKSNRGEIREDIRIREESMQQLIAHMKAMENAYGKDGRADPGCVGGDFNATPEEPRFAGEERFPLYWQTVSVGPAGNPFFHAHHDAARSAVSRSRFRPNFLYRGATLARAWVTNTSPHNQSDHRFAR